MWLVLTNDKAAGCSDRFCSKRRLGCYDLHFDQIIRQSFVFTQKLLVLCIRSQAQETKPK